MTSTDCGIRISKIADMDDLDLESGWHRCLHSLRTMPAVIYPATLEFVKIYKRFKCKDDKDILTKNLRDSNLKMTQ